MREVESVCLRESIILKIIVTLTKSGLKLLLAEVEGGGKLDGVEVVHIG